MLTLFKKAYIPIFVYAGIRSFFLCQHIIYGSLDAHLSTSVPFVLRRLLVAFPLPKGWRCWYFTQNKKHKMESTVIRDLATAWECQQLKPGAHSAKVDGAAALEDYCKASCYSHWHEKVPITTHTAGSVRQSLRERGEVLWSHVKTCQLEKGLVVSMHQNCICRYLYTLLSLASHSPFMGWNKKERLFRRETSFSFTLPCPNKQFYGFKVNYDMARHLMLINGADTNTSRGV